MAGEQRPRIGVHRCGEQRAGRAGLNRLPRIDDAGFVAQLGDDAEIVRHEQHRQAELGGQLAEQDEDLLLRRHVESGRRLVGDHQRRIAGERRGDQQALPLPAGKLVRIALQRHFRIGQMHPPQQFKEAAAMLRLVAVGRMPAHDFKQLPADLEDRVQRQIGILRDKPDAAAANPPAELRFGQFQQ